MDQRNSPVSVIGKTLGRHPRKTFGIRQADRLFHMYIVGQTGTGKSALMANLARQDIAANRGFCLIDPHGDLAVEVAKIAVGDARYWDIADPACGYGYNPLTFVLREYRPLVASAIIDTLKQQWADAWGARMEHLLRFALLALLELPDARLTDILPLFTEKQFRWQVVARIKDEQVARFWRKEFPAMNYKNAADGIAPIANKLGAFLAHPVVRKSVSDPEHPLRFRRMMDKGETLIVNLAKGRLGADIADVLGGLIVSSVMHAALSRQNSDSDTRLPYVLYVDEFQTFTSSAFVNLLSEMRKYGLGLVLAHQHTGQLKESVLDAVLGNAGTVICFRVGARDAALMVRQLGGFEPRDLIHLANYELAMKMMIDGKQSKAFSARTFASWQ